jgi:hypothetical protein
MLRTSPLMSSCLRALGETEEIFTLEIERKDRKKGRKEREEKRKQQKKGKSETNS